MSPLTQGRELKQRQPKRKDSANKSPLTQGRELKLATRCSSPLKSAVAPHAGA